MVKKIFTLNIIVILAVAMFLGQRVSAAVSDFKILSFTADYYLERDDQKVSILKVSEEIIAEFPNTDQNHGILRAIPASYDGHTLSLRVESVTDENGKPWNYTTEDQNDNLVLKIGDADKYVHGRQSYRINYSMRNVISFNDTGDEFYWDINGDQWTQSFDTVTARVHIPKTLATSLDGQKRCFAGFFGQTNEQTCSIEVLEANDETVLTSTANNLSPSKTLTLVIGFNKDTFQLGPEIAAEKRREQIILIAVAISAVTPPIYTGFWLYRRWKQFGRDPSGRGVIVPEYLAPQNLDALSSSAILKEHVESKAVSALIIELAVKKYLKIYEIPKKGIFGKTDYEIEVIQDPSGLSNEQMQALRMFFSDGVVKDSKVKLSILKNKLYSEMPKLSKNVDAKLFEQGYFASNPDTTRSSYTKRGIILIVIGSVISILLFTIPFGVGLIVSGFIIILVAKIMPARSQRGVEARDYLLGLRDYMKLAEADRLKFLQSPQGAEKLPAGVDPKDPKSQVKLFESLLPYAMLFGIEKDWAKQFEHLYTQPPDWYSGNWSTFSAVHLASSLGGFSASSAASFTSPSSSGSSGFGGGGFSGGGGGGGGGGGW